MCMRARVCGQVAVSVCDRSAVWLSRLQRGRRPRRPAALDQRLITARLVAAKFLSDSRRPHPATSALALSAGIGSAALPYHKPR